MYIWNETKTREQDPQGVIATLCFFRFWLGFGIGGDYSLSATIMSEYANKKTRGAFLLFFVFAMQDAKQAAADMSKNLFQKDIFSAIGWIPKANAMNALDEVFKIARAQTLIALCSTVPGYWFTVAFIDHLGRVWYCERKLHDFECTEFGIANANSMTLNAQSLVLQTQTPCLGMHRVWYCKRKLHDFECTKFGIANANSMSWNAQSLVSRTQTP
ncbi:hypothetical protein IFM89_008793 [Coptis chinensis]|uniref:Uncharacterized protein n=1 Tax=Coptis chinensis TaxID=261450 RepID=A0A835GYQ0_9MAGN|nr:hypothetical protein IFM89_008793 [Coptis chinensis]